MDKVERSRRVVAIIVADEKPVVGTIELAERFAISQQAMSKHLKDIAELGYLHTDKIGRSRVWWPTQSVAYGLSLLRSARSIFSSIIPTASIASPCPIVSGNTLCQHNSIMVMGPLVENRHTGRSASRKIGMPACTRRPAGVSNQTT